MINKLLAFVLKLFHTKEMTLKEKYTNYNLVHFIEMYDDVITIEGHALNAVIFEGKEYVISVLEEINDLEERNEEHLILEYMNICFWTDEEEKSITRIKKELEEIKDIETGLE
jgi:hypothetical protein